MKVLGLVLLVSAFLVLLASVPASDAAQTYSLRALTGSALTADTIDFQFGTTNNPVGKYFQLQWSEAGKNSWKNFGGTRQVPSTRRFSITPSAQGIAAGTYDFRAKVGSTSSSLNDETNVAKIVLSGASSSSSSGSTAGGSTGSTTSGTSSGSTSTTTNATSTTTKTSNCQYTCSAYKYSEGQCVQGWQCMNGCISYNQCSQSTSSGTASANATGQTTKQIVSCTARNGYIEVGYSNGSASKFVDSCGYSSGSGEYGWQNYVCGYASGGEPYFWLVQNPSGNCTKSSASSSTTTAASTTSTCRFTCSAYGYSEGQCVQGWQCTNGCITYNSCATGVVRNSYTVFFGNNNNSRYDAHSELYPSVGSNGVYAKFVFDQDIPNVGTIASPRYTDYLRIELLGKSFYIAGVGSFSIKLLTGTRGTAGISNSSSYGSTFGAYTILPAAGVDSEWVKLEIRDNNNKVVDTISNVRIGDTKTSLIAGLDIKVTKIEVTGTDPKTQQIDIEYIAGQSGSIESEYDAAADVSSTSKEGFPGKNGYYIIYNATQGSSPGIIKSGSAIEVVIAGSGTSSCQYTCSAYGYGENQCYQGWQCINGCINYNSCTASGGSGSSCQFSCSSYGYSEGQCVQGWKCANGCIKYNSCVQ